MNNKEYKIGDTLKCLPGFDTSEESGGNGWKEGKIFKVTRITNHNVELDKIIYWSDTFAGGVYGRALTLPDEIINDYPIY